MDDDNDKFVQVGRKGVGKSNPPANHKKCNCEHCIPKTGPELRRWQKELKMKRVKEQVAAKARAVAEYQKKLQENQQRK